MARQSIPEPPGDDVPSWVMTFSDVITLLMTFFILLLTFATNEQETFDRMRVTVFGAGGASGIAGTKEGMEKDAMLMRERARSGRIAQDGTETPPIYSDPSLSTLDKGIAGLEDDEFRELSKSHRFSRSLSKLIASDGNYTMTAKRHMELLSRQIRARQMRIELFAHEESVLPKVLKIVQLLETFRVSPISIAVGVDARQVKPGQMLFVIVDQGIPSGS